jgi:hypothetical protein
MAATVLDFSPVDVCEFSPVDRSDHDEALVLYWSFRFPVTNAVDTWASRRTFERPVRSSRTRSADDVSVGPVLRFVRVRTAHDIRVVHESLPPACEWRDVAPPSVRSTQFASLSFR